MNLRRIAYLIVFGAVWGGFEMFLGALLHTIHFPLTGMIMAGIGAYLICSLQLWVGGKGNAITIGVIAALLKIFSIGGLVLSPAIAIFLEGLIAELLFILVKGRLTSAIFVGMGMVFYTIIHHFSSLILIYNREIKDTLNVLSRDFKFLHPGQSQSLLLLAILYLLVHLAWGFVMGLLAYLTVKRTMKRLSPKIAD